MNFSSGIVLVLLISIFAQSNDTNLATNTNILLILLLALYGASGNNCTNTTSTCGGLNLF